MVVPESNLARIPAALSWIEAAAVPEVFITAHDAILTRAGLQMGERVLIHAAGSGVGTAAVQLAHAAGASVYGTSRTADKLEQAQSLGLDEGIAVGGSLEEFVDRVQELTAGAGVNVIVDLVGGSYFPANLKAIATGGRIICVGTTAAKPKSISASSCESGLRSLAPSYYLARLRRKRKPQASLPRTSCPWFPRPFPTCRQPRFPGRGGSGGA